MKTGPNRGSHLPVLIELFSKTTGSILELGCGMYSTPYLHWACHSTRRRLVTFESDPQWFPFLKQFESEFHLIYCIDDWDTIDISEPWSIAFVDHSPNQHRWKEIVKLQHADFVVAHDAENSANHKYGYSRIHKLFLYRYKYTDTFNAPFTAVFSNVYDVRKLKI
jgi:hypothetical protein